MKFKSFFVFTLVFVMLFSSVVPPGMAAKTKKTSVAANVLLVDDFDQAHSVNHLGGGYGLVAEGGDARLSFLKPPVTNLTNSSSLKINYKFKTSPGYSFLWMKLGKHKQSHEETEYLDLTGFVFLSFKYQSRRDLNFKIELHEDVDANGRFDIRKDRSDSIYVDTVKRFSLEGGWTKVLIPLKRFTGIKDWSKMLEMVFVFEKDHSGASGEILLEDLLFIRKEIKKPNVNRHGQFFEKPKVFFNGVRAASDQTLKGENKVTVQYQPGPRFQDLESVSLEIKTEKEGVWFPAATEVNPGLAETNLLWEAFTFSPPPGFSLRVTASDFFGNTQVIAGPFESMRVPAMTDDEFLNLVSRKAFQYFMDTYDKPSGLFFDATGGGDLSTAVTGFGLTALVIGAERGWITKKQAQAMIKKCLRSFLTKVEEKEGFYYHFINAKTLKRAGNSEISTVDTAILLAGMITAAEYFGGNIKTMTEKIYRKAKWDYFIVNDENDEHWMHFRHGWMPEEGLMESYWDYYTDETIIVALLGIGAPSHPVPPEVFYRFQRRDGKIGDLPPFIISWHGSLFSYQYAGAWYDFRGLVDDKGVDWFENSTIATLANREFSLQNAEQYKTYGKDTWGITGMRLPDRYVMDYGPLPNGQNKAYHDGTISPSGPGGSMIFTPYLALRMLKNLYLEHPDTWGIYGLKDSLNLDRNYISPVYYGLGEGILLLAIENFRSGMVWKYFMKNSHVQKSLKLAKFRVNPEEKKPSAFPDLKKQIDSASKTSRVKVIDSILDQPLSLEDLKLLDQELTASDADSQDPKTLMNLGRLQILIIRAMQAHNLEAGRLYIKEAASYNKKALSYYEKALKGGLPDSERLDVYTKMIQVLQEVMAPAELDVLYEKLALELKEGIKRKSYNLPWALHWAARRDEATALRLRKEFYGDLSGKERKVMFESLKRKARDYFVRGDYRKAAEMNEEQIRFMEAPTYRRVLVTFLERTAKAFTEVQSYPEAERFYLKIIDSYGSDEDREKIIPQYAAMLEQKGDMEKAAREWEAYIDSFPKSAGVPDAMMKIAGIQNSLGNRSAAVTTLKKVSQDYPGTPASETAMYKLGMMLYKADHYSEAVKVWEEMLKSFPKTSHGSVIREYLERADEKQSLKG